jgi:hypothetical protein
MSRGKSREGGEGDGWFWGLKDMGGCALARGRVDVADLWRRLLFEELGGEEHLQGKRDS